MPALKSCLWFHADAQAAAELYVSLFPNSRVATVMPGPGGVPTAVDFVLDGAPFLALNGRREDGFTDATSFVVPCASQAEIDRYWDALVADGGAEGRCGWLTDRFGVSWQIVPADMGALLGGPDAAASGRAMQAMMAMRKIDVDALRRARAGA